MFTKTRHKSSTHRINILSETTLKITDYRRTGSKLKLYSLFNGVMSDRKVNNIKLNPFDYVRSLSDLTILDRQPSLFKLL